MIQAIFRIIIYGDSKERKRHTYYEQNFVMPENPPQFMKIEDHIINRYWCPIITVTYDPILLDYFKNEVGNFKNYYTFTFHNNTANTYDIIHYYRFSPLTENDINFLAKVAMTRILQCQHNFSAKFHACKLNKFGLLLGGIILEYAKKHEASQEIIDLIRLYARYFIFTFNFWSSNPFDDFYNRRRIFFKTGEVINPSRTDQSDHYEILRRFEDEIEERCLKQEYMQPNNDGIAPKNIKDTISFSEFY